MRTIQFEDRLEPLGIGVGALLVLMGLGTLIGAPWATAASTVTAVIQVVGALVSAAIGIGLAWLSYES